MKSHLSLPRFCFALALIIIGAAYLFQTLGMMPHPVIYYVKHYGWASLIFVIALWRMPRSFIVFLLLMTLSVFLFLRGAGYLHHSLMTYVIGDGWPIGLFAFGVWLMRRMIKGSLVQRNLGSLLLFLFGLMNACIGIGLLLDRFHIMTFNYAKFYSVVWPVVLMILGISFLFGGRVGYRHEPRKVENLLPISDVEQENVFSDTDHRLRTIGRDTNQHLKKEGFLIGDYKLGGSEAWTFKDTSVWHAIGDVEVDLRQAVFEERESQLIIRGLIGDVRVIVPPTLPVRIFSELSIGEIQLFSTEQGGIGRKATFISLGYEEADRKLDIYIALKVGEVGVDKG